MALSFQYSVLAII